MRPLYHPAREDLALPTLLHALSDPARLRIVRHLARQGESPCGAIGLPVAKSTQSQHFKILREAGVTRTRVVGTQRLMSLRRDDVDARFPGLLQAILGAPDAP